MLLRYKRYIILNESPVLVGAEFISYAHMCIMHMQLILTRSVGAVIGPKASYAALRLTGIILKEIWLEAWSCKVETAACLQSQ